MCLSTFRLATLSALLSSSAMAGQMFQPLSATTDMGSYSAIYQTSRFVDQTGLAIPYVSGVTSFPSYTATTGTILGGSSLNTWFSQQGVVTGNFDFNLGSPQKISALALWADPQGVGQTVKDFTLIAASDAAFTSPTTLGTYTMNDGTGIPNNGTNYGQVFSFTPVTATFVRMHITSNHGSTATTGLVEGAFEIVPEPATLTFLVAALLPLTRPRRRHP